jgi:adenylylsulfate kinase-like enzyme
MNLIFLHGPPASGKHTIAQALQESWGVLNFHNHLTLDVAKSLFDFGTPEFWALTHRLRQVALRAKASDTHARVVFTNCYSRPHDDSNVEALEEIVTGPGGEFIPVYLHCGVEELRRRVGDPSRIAMRKLHTAEGLEEFMDRWNCVALDRSNCVTVSTEGRAPSDCVAEIARRLSL